MTYIVLEGIDGCGKDTQARLLDAHFRHRGQIPLVLNEPSKSPQGLLLRQMLQQGTFTEAHVAMFLADRMTLMVQEVLPALEAGRPVISSRSFCSTLVYQQEHWDLEWLYAIHSRLPASPTRVFILDLPVEVSLQRVHRRATQEVYETQDILTRVRQRYLDLAQDPRLQALMAPEGRVHVVDATDKYPVDVHRCIEELL
jgi:dTMP kinase